MLSVLSDWRKNRALKPYRAQVEKICALEPQVSALSDDELKARFAALRQELAGGSKLKGLVPEVFAVIREAAHRTLGLRPFEVQLLGGLVLANGSIAEMATGEGKTLVAPFAVCLHYLQGRKVHIGTANEYLAQRDANVMLPLYRFLGLKVAVRLAAAPAEMVKGVYSCDVVYGTEQQFAMDYLHDNLVRTSADVWQRGHGALILDEADSALIDNAKIPVVLTATTPADVARYQKLAEVAAQLVRGESEQDDCDFYLDGQNRQAVLTDRGYETVNGLLVATGLLAAEVPLYSGEHQHVIQRVTAALGAQHLLVRDHDYVVQDGQIVLIDALTGRLIPGRRWDSGLHQAIEAKEGLSITPENVVLGQITLQNYFKLYESLAGMTGTATTEAEELLAVYGLHVVEIPTNKQCIRVDEPDRFFRTLAEKLDAVVADIQKRHTTGQPVLIGTASVEQSEQLSARLKALGLKHEVLNARQHAREAEIIAQAGDLGAITVSTNMAGRGVDIVLGGRVELDVFRAQLKAGSRVWQDYFDVLAAAIKSASGADLEEAVKNARQQPTELLAVDYGPGEGFSKMLASLGLLHEVTDGKIVLLPGSEATIEQAKMVRALELELPAEQMAEITQAQANRRERVLAAGGLHIIGMERYESRRMDRQLRGRAGRQGDPGSTCFYISLEDPMVENFAGENIRTILRKLEVEEGDDFEGAFVAKQVNAAQRQVEGKSAAARKHLMTYDNVLDEQRRAFYGQRAQVLQSADNLSWLKAQLQAYAKRLCEQYASEEVPAQYWDMKGLERALKRHGTSLRDALNLDALSSSIATIRDLHSAGLASDEDVKKVEDLVVPDLRSMEPEDVASLVAQRLEERLELAFSALEPQYHENLARHLIQSTMDRLWIAHLDELDHLRRGIHLRALAKDDPQRAYKREAFALFGAMLDNLPEEVLHAALNVVLVTDKTDGADQVAEKDLSAGG